MYDGHKYVRVTISAPDVDADDVVVRRARRADLLAIVRIENASFPQPWPYDAFETFLGEPGFLVAVTDDDRIVGYVVADVTTTHGRSIGHIKDIAVHPACRGRGVGSRLLTRSFVTLASHGADSVKLEVRTSNEDAKRLYREYGFESLRRIRGYYDDDEDAIIMVRELE
ncbi:ribosomal protein S18-alanine N-acetyltransferase [Natrialbaceae archaeon AArc-T1-2]|uniref:ribosomal protein S18-alanine N-acetyltransferase n=1 Tax=Natrialbaceae archaeon AArc-T1-2 TaxID=3053904 RepID=UPI00255AFA94|nr:ribosomal protein S18-alanine N-acetyltransferase [Natrialbaceae archaeon AArc-T1-2]WIV68286.1 ribosomal protein S18-alanine N-acetyltransferase [Natrialbaceae archaeon AArc-T1-2]